VTGDDADATRPWRNRWRSIAGVAALLAIVSVVPIPGGVLDVGSPSTGGSGVIPMAISLTDPFHVVGYAILAALVSRVTRRTSWGLFVAVVAATGFGFAIELVQAPIPWRTFAWRDVAINAVGATLGAVLAAANDRYRARGSR